MTLKKIYKEIEASLTDDTAKEEHKRIWPSFSQYFKETYLSTYLTYLETFGKLHRLMNVDTSAMQTKELYLHQNIISGIQRQHADACKSLQFTPKHDKTPLKTGRPSRDTSKEGLFE